MGISPFLPFLTGQKGHKEPHFDKLSAGLGRRAQHNEQVFTLLIIILGCKALIGNGLRLSLP
jgi:hypothetical protein